MIFSNLVSAETVLQHKDDPNWVIFDCSFHLDFPEKAEAAFLNEHIPNSAYAHLNRDLSSPVTEFSGRHPLPDQAEFHQFLQRNGVTNHSQVIVYDNMGGGMAVRLWWMLRACGHTAVAVLDGGLHWWKVQNYPLETGTTTPKQLGDFSKPFDDIYFVDTAFVEEIHCNPEYILIDARSEDRFRGENETIDRIGGHIPCAVNLFFGKLNDADQRLLPMESIRAQFAAFIPTGKINQTIVYCGSGVTSCRLLLALDVIGAHGAKLYTGSWSAWISNPAHTVAC